MRVRVLGDRLRWGASPLGGTVKLVLVLVGGWRPPLLQISDGVGEINPGWLGLLESGGDRPRARAGRRAGGQTDGAEGPATVIYLLRLCPYICVCVCDFQV